MTQRNGEHVMGKVHVSASDCTSTECNSQGAAGGGGERERESHSGVLRLRSVCRIRLHNNTMPLCVLAEYGVRHPAIYKSGVSYGHLQPVPHRENVVIFVA